MVYIGTYIGINIEPILTYHIHQIYHTTMHVYGGIYGISILHRHEIKQKEDHNYPICSMYGILTNMYPINDPNIEKYFIHGAPGYV